MATDVTLITYIRQLLEDSTTPYVVSADQIENIIKTRRRLVYYEPLYSEDELTWYATNKYVDVITLADGYEGDAVTPSASDAIEGRWVFTTKQTSVYVHGNVLDLLDVVSRLWLVKAGELSILGPSYSLGDETVDKGSTQEYCIKQHWRYATSKGGQLSRS